MAQATGRRLHTQQTHYLRKRINYSDVGIGNGVLLGTIPGNSICTNCHCRVNTPFNAGTTNNITVGTTPLGADLVAAGTFTASAQGGYTGVPNTLVGNTTLIGVPEIALSTTYIDQDIWVAYTYTGTAPTQGQADIVLSYIPDNDQ